MSRDYSLARDLAELEQMTERLGDYVLGDKLYLPLSAAYSRRSRLPQLSAGALLLRRRRLMRLRWSLSDSQQSRLSKALRRHDVVQREWTLHYENKLKGEAPARLKQMRAFFRDCQENPSGCASAYPPEALRRTMAAEILLAMDAFGYDKRELLPGVEQTDLALRRLLHAGEFIWSPLLAPAYPRDDFWWLYGSPA